MKKIIKRRYDLERDDVEEMMLKRDDLIKRRLKKGDVIEMMFKRRLLKS